MKRTSDPDLSLSQGALIHFGGFSDKSLSSDPPKCQLCWGGGTTIAVLSFDWMWVSREH